MIVHTLFGILRRPGIILALARTRSTAASISSAVSSGGPSLSSQGVASSAGSCRNNWSAILTTPPVPFARLLGGGGSDLFHYDFPLHLATQLHPPALFTFPDGSFQVPSSLLVLVSLLLCHFSASCSLVLLAQLIGFRFEMSYLLCPPLHFTSLPAWTLLWHCCVIGRSFGDIVSGLLELIRN